MGVWTTWKFAGPTMPTPGRFASSTCSSWWVGVANDFLTAYLRIALGTHPLNCFLPHWPQAFLPRTEIFFSLEKRNVPSAVRNRKESLRASEVFPGKLLQLLSSTVSQGARTAGNTGRFATFARICTSIRGKEDSLEGVCLQHMNSNHDIRGDSADCSSDLI